MNQFSVFWGATTHFVSNNQLEFEIISGLAWGCNPRDSSANRKGHGTARFFQLDLCPIEAETVSCRLGLCGLRQAETLSASTRIAELEKDLRMAVKTAAKVQCVLCFIHF